MFLERASVLLLYLGLEVFVRVVAEQVDIREVAADKGTNVTIPCGAFLKQNTSNVQWVHRGNRTHHTVLTGGGNASHPMVPRDAARQLGAKRAVDYPNEYQFGSDPSRPRARERTAIGPQITV
ncbi:unnamed protein product, partial [Iphiclides podalirius]